jgi:hypothetical protein
MPVTQPPQPRFRTTQDWQNFLGSTPLNSINLQDLRIECYRKIEALRGRPLLIYATKFLETPQGTPNQIDLSDIDGFTDLANSIPDNQDVDILIHSPGGRPDATERIVNILRSNFNNIHFIVPHSAYSAATMLALSGDTICIHPSGTLGPIDPQLNGTPARSIKRGFEKVREVIKNEGPEALPAYIPLIEKYTLDLLEICDDSENLSKELVTQWLNLYMFRDENQMPLIEKAVEYFSNYDLHLLHSRPLLFSKLTEFELKITQAEPPLRDLIWEAYILINGFFNLSAFVKLFECAHGVSWGKQFQVGLPVQQPARQEE